MLQLCTINIFQAIGGKEKNLEDNVRNHTRKIESELFFILSANVQIAIDHRISLLMNPKN